MDNERMALVTVDYVIFGIMLLVSAGIGVYFRFSGGKQKTTEEYLLAGKDMSILPVAFSLMASFLSAITVIGTPADMYRFGIHLAYMNIGTIVGLFIATYLFLPVFFNLETFTVYGYLEKRFGKLTRTVNSLAFVAQMILYMSVVLYAPALALSAVTNLSTWVSVISIGVVCTFYCTLGGMKAVLWTDVFQAILMYLGIFAVIIKGCLDIGGYEIFRRASHGGRIVVPSWDATDYTSRYTMWNIILQGMILTMAAFGSNQVQVQRLLTVKNIERSRLAILVSIPMSIGFQLLNCFTGLIIYAAYYKCDPMTSPAKPISSADQLMPFYMMTSLADYPGLPGLCICGIFSASLSTVSSAVNSLSAVTMEDFVRPFLESRGTKQKNAAFITKAITLFYGGLCIALTFLVATFGNLVQAALTVFGMLGGPVLAVFVLGMFTTRSNEKGVIIGLLTSVIFCAWMSFGGTANAPPPVDLPVSTEDCASVNLANSTLLNLLNLSAATGERNFSTNFVEASPLHSNRTFFEEIAKSKDDDYIFPLYRISYMWVTPIGFLMSMVVGYLCSILIICITGEQNQVPRECLSPIFSWLCYDKEEAKEKDMQISAPVQIGLTQNGKQSEVLYSHHF